MLPLIPSDPKGTRSWPLHDHGRQVTYHRLSWLLTHRHPTDAFTSAYSVPALERRLSSGAVARLADGVPMAIYLWDYDCTGAHKATGGDGSVQADDAWWALTVQRVAPLLRAHPGGFVYRTRGGARIVYQRPEPLVLRQPGDELVWRREYLGCLAYLARRFGIACDPQTHDWPRLMRLPRATRDGVALDLAMVGDARRVGGFVYEPDARERDANLDAVRAMAHHDPRWLPIARSLAGNDAARSPRVARSVAPVDATAVDAGVLAQLATDLGTAMVGLVGNHAAHLALAGACYDRGIPLAAGPELGRAIAAAKGGQDRSQVWQTTADRVRAGDAVLGWGSLVAGYPHLAAIVDAALPSGGGAKGLRDELDARGQDPGVPAADVAALLRAAIDRRDTGPSLVRVTEGAGKTRVSLAVLQDRARAVPAEASRVLSADKALYVAPSHAVAEAMAEGLRGLRAEYWRSPLAVRDAAGQPLCTQHGRVAAMAAAGQSVTAWCESPCPDRDGCPARDQAIVRLGGDAPPAVVVTVHALLDQGQSWAGEDALVIVDEDPEALTAVEITRAQLDATVAAMDLFGEGEAFRGPVLQALAAGLERGGLPTGEAFREVLSRGCAALTGDGAWEAACLACFGTLDAGVLAEGYAFHAGWRRKTTPAGESWVRRAAWAPWPTRVTRGRVFAGQTDPRLASASKVHALVGRLAAGIVRLAPEGRVCRERGVSQVEVSHADPSRRVLRGVMASPAVGDGLRRYGPTVLLDATAEPAVLHALAGAAVPTTTLRVADGAPVTRSVLYWSGATRRAVFAGTVVRWDAGLARYLAEALRRAMAFKPGGKVALFGWEALVRLFREGTDPVVVQLVALVTGAGGTIVAGHYGAARGRNDWMDCDVLISVGDPYPNLGASRAIAAVLGLSHDHGRLYRHLTAAELSQVSGRLRAPWRATPALHLHVGTVAPLGWDARAEVLELPKGLTETLDPRAAAEAVHVYGSQRLAAAALGVHRNTISFAVSPFAQSNTIKNMDGGGCAHGDTAESLNFSASTRVSAAILVPPPFDDAAQLALMARCGGPKTVAAMLGVHRATAYQWATTKGTRRMPEEARRTLEALLDDVRAADGCGAL